MPFDSIVHPTDAAHDRHVQQLEAQLAEQAAALRAAQAHVQKLQSLIDVSNDWVWEVNAQAVYTYVSPQVHTFLGYTPEEVLGHTPFDFMPPEEAARVAEIFGPIAAAQEPVRALENLNQHKDGHLVLIETSGVPIFDAQGAFCGYRGVDRDITERRQAEREQVRLQAEIIVAQQRALADLSTPVLPIWEHVLVVPLIGTVDSARAQQLHTVVLDAVARQHATWVIVDITGVPLVDTHVASMLVAVAQAVRLLGAQMILTGIRPEVAQTLVSLGVHLDTLTPRGTLQQGIAHALGGVGRVPLPRTSAPRGLRA